MSGSRACFIVGFVVTYVTLVKGYGSGSPESSCDTMAITHKKAGGAQSGNSSFVIELSSTNVKKSGTISVRVMSPIAGNYFQGILLKAIKADQPIRSYVGTAGYFTIAEADADLYHYLNCSLTLRTAVTHSTSVNKTEATFIWQPHKNSSPGTYVFVASIAKDYYDYWLPIRSKPIVNAGLAEHADKCTLFVVAILAIMKCTCM